MGIILSKIMELERRISLLEGRIKEVNKEKDLLKKSYNKSLAENISKLNDANKILQFKNEKLLGLKELQTPKTITANCFEDVLLNSIKYSQEFKECVKHFKEGDLKALSLKYDIDKLKKINQEIEIIKGVGITKPVESGHKSSERLREDVEERLKEETFTKIDDATGTGYTYEDYHIKKRGTRR